MHGIWDRLCFRPVSLFEGRCRLLPVGFELEPYCFPARPCGHAKQDLLSCAHKYESIENASIMHARAWCSHAYTDGYIHTYTYIHIYICICMYIYIYMYMHRCRLEPQRLQHPPLQAADIIGKLREMPFEFTTETGKLRACNPCRSREYQGPIKH